jgi:hypothetical protein
MVLGVVLSSNNDTWLVTRCIHISICITPMHVRIKLVSNMLLSGVSCWSREARVHCSTPETMRDMCVNHTAVDSQRRVRELFSPTCNGLGFGEARSGLERSLDLSMT